MRKKTRTARKSRSKNPWIAKALAAIQSEILVFGFDHGFTADHVMDRLSCFRGLGRPRNPNDVGALFRTASVLGMIKPTGKTVPSDRPEAHRRLIRTWKTGSEAAVRRVVIPVAA